MFGKHRQSRKHPIVSYSTRKLYHGTPVNFDTIDVERNVGNSLDFGSGFYTTEDRDYALRYAGMGAGFSESRVGYVRNYLFDEDLAKEQLDVKYIDGPNMDWLDHLIAYRIRPFEKPPYDITIGPSADSEIQAILNEYYQSPLHRRIEREITVERLKPHAYPTQYVFHSKGSVKEPFLILIDIDEVDV